MGSKKKMTDLAVPLLVIVNVAIFYIYNNPPWPGTQAFFDANFVASRVAIKDYRLWTLVTSLFLHKDIVHLLISTLGLVSIGLMVEDLVGSKWFFEYFLISGFVGSMNHVMISPLVNQPLAPVYGSTAPLTAIMILAALIYRDKTVWLFKVIPLRPAWGGMIFLGLDLLGMPFSDESVNSPIGHGAHIGAAAVGLIYYHKVLRHRVWRNLRAEDKEKRLFQVQVTGKVNWLIPCDSERFDDMKVFLRDVLGMQIAKEGTPDIDNKIQRYTRFATPSGNVEVVEPERFSRDIFQGPILSLTVDNLAAACKNLDSRKIEFVAPIFHTKENWALIYFRAPDGRIYQIQGPYPNA